MTVSRMTKAALSVALIAGLAACGNDDSGKVHFIR